MGIQAAAKLPFIEYGASFKSIVPLAANTPETIFTAGSNANGAIVWRASFTTQANGSLNMQASIIAKASAPSTVVDGDVIVSPNFAAYRVAYDYVLVSAGLESSIYIPAGKGLYYISSVAEHASAIGLMRSLIYSLL